MSAFYHQTVIFTSMRVEYSRKVFRKKIAFVDCAKILLKGADR